MHNIFTYMHIWYTSTLQTDTISNDQFNTLQNINTALTIQSQINTLNQYVSNGSSGGGYFSLLCGLTNGFSTSTPFFLLTFFFC